MVDALGCEPELLGSIDVVSKSTTVATVPLLSWSTSEEVQPFVVTDVGRTEWLVSPVSDSKSSSGDVLVLGIPFLRESTNIVVADTEAGRACSEPIYREAATMDPSIPELSLTTSDPDQAQGGYTVLGMITDGASFVVIVDEYGEYVWIKTMGLGVVSRAVFSEDSSSILYMSWAERLDEPGTVYRLGLDGEVQESFEMSAAHTDFVQLPDGGMAAIAWDLRELEDGDGVTRRILGDSIVELDSEGNERVVWSVFDSYEPDLSLSYATTSLGPEKDLEDWSHGNGLAYDAEQDDYLISVFGLGSLLRIDRQTGTTAWILSDSHGDFASSTDDLLVQGTHSVEAVEEDRVLIFNRNVPNPLDEEADPLDERCSEALEIELNTETGEATKVWSYGTDECVLVVYFGEAIRLENGNTLVIFSSSGQVSETNSAGETVWQINTDLGAAFGFGSRQDSLY
jgi:hypothetical protein